MRYPIDTDDDVMTFDEFKGCVDCGLFTNYDGTGYYSDGETLDRSAPVNCEKLDPSKGDHVVWYNK